MVPGRRKRRTLPGAGVVLAASLSIAAVAEPVPDTSVKAALLFNFAKFVTWPALVAGAPIVLCVAGDAAIGDALVDTVRGQRIGRHELTVLRPRDNALWQDCLVLFMAAAVAGQAGHDLNGIQARPILTVSDRRGFARDGGMIELYIEGGRMRFAINVDAVERSGLHLSSRLLTLARIMRDSDVQ